MQPRSSDDAAAVRERSTAGGSVRVFRSGPGRLSMVFRGSLVDDDGTFIAAWLDEVLPTCEHAVIDVALDELDSYTSAVRIRTQQALARHGQRWTTVVCFVRSRIVAMGVAVANFALGGRIQACTDRESFERAIEQAIAARPSASR